MKFSGVIVVGCCRLVGLWLFLFVPQGMKQSHRWQTTGIHENRPVLIASESLLRFALSSLGRIRRCEGVGVPRLRKEAGTLERARAHGRIVGEAVWQRRVQALRRPDAPHFRPGTYSRGVIEPIRGNRTTQICLRGAQRIAEYKTH